MPPLARLLVALVLAASIAAAGWFVGRGFVAAKTADRYVAVKGLAERDVEADIALWPLRFVATDDSLAAAQAVLKQGEQKVREFLGRHGIEPAAISVRRLEVNDLLANPYRSGAVQSRYILTKTLLVRTDQPKLVKAASQDISALVDAGVVLSAEGGPSTDPTYLFTRLNELKPPMIAEAIANARLAADQFATDSGSRVGGLRGANQGVFVILPRDRQPDINEAAELHKTVRVVSTLEYYLRD